MCVVIPNSLTVNKCFASKCELIQHASMRAETSPKLDCDSNAFTLMARIEPHRRGYKLVSLFYLDNGLVAQMCYQNNDIHSFAEVECGEF